LQGIKSGEFDQQMAIKAKEWTISGLAVELRMDTRKLGGMLEGLKPHRTSGSGKQIRQYFWLRDVFDWLQSGEDTLDPQQEQAKLAEVRRIRIEIQNEILKGELCRTEEVEKLWADQITNAKNRLRAIPHKLAHQVMAATDHAEGLRILERGIQEVLEELAGTGSPDPTAAIDGSGEEGLESAAEADG
jgi:hypothetical protein